MNDVPLNEVPVVLPPVEPEPIKVREITPEQQKAIDALGNHLLHEYFANLHPTDKGKKTNPVEVLVRSAIRHVIEIIGPSATPEQVAAGLYEVLHIGDNIKFQLKRIGDEKIDAIVDGLSKKKHHRH